jgi:hypothetical protein
MYSKLILLLLLLLFVSCKKEENSNTSISTGSKKQLIIDSIFLYTKSIYIWNDDIPNYDTSYIRSKYEKISPDISAFRQELFDLCMLKINPLTGLPYEWSNLSGLKYSNIEYTNEFNNNKLASAKTTIYDDMILSTFDNLTYLSINSFPPLSSIQHHIDNVFKQISVSQPQTLVIDLRNNKGGNVETTQYVANHIIPKVYNNNKMYTQVFNNDLRSGKASLLKKWKESYYQRKVCYFS